MNLQSSAAASCDDEAAIALIVSQKVGSQTGSVRMEGSSILHCVMGLKRKTESLSWFTKASHP